MKKILVLLLFLSLNNYVLGAGSDSSSDTSSVAKFLLSEESSWITGQIFGVDGGRSTVA